jgi:hypothetical protein
MKRILLAALLCISFAGVQAQETYNSSGKPGKASYKQNQNKKGFDVNRLVFGGGLGLTFGTITNIYVAPSIGYRFTDNFAAGITLGYNYYREKNAFEVPNLHHGGTKAVNITQSIYSGSVWGRYIIIPNLFVQAEFEMNNWDFYTRPTNGYQYDKDGWAIIPKDRITVPSLLLGAGFRQPVGDYSSFFIMAMYDVIQDATKDANGNKQSPYANRVDFRIGFNIGF